MCGVKRLSMRKETEKHIVIELKYLQSMSKEIRADGVSYEVRCKKSWLEWINDRKQVGEGYRAISSILVISIGFEAHYILGSIYAMELIERFWSGSITWSVWVISSRLRDCSRGGG